MLTIQYKLTRLDIMLYAALYPDEWNSYFACVIRSSAVSLVVNQLSKSTKSYNS